MTLDELERLEKAATPGPWRSESEFVHGPNDITITLTQKTGEESLTRFPNAALIAAARNALPELIKIARAVAESSPGIPGPDGDSEKCCLCGGFFMRWTKDGKLSDEAVEELHADGCAWLLARKLAGAGQ